MGGPSRQRSQEHVLRGLQLLLLNRSTLQYSTMTACTLDTVCHDPAQRGISAQKFKAQVGSTNRNDASASMSLRGPEGAVVFQKVHYTCYRFGTIMAGIWRVVENFGSITPANCKNFYFCTAVQSLNDPKQQEWKSEAKGGRRWHYGTYHGG